ncbi:helix-turn-helix domain-containing protein [Chengkuizengella sp. SCS-71B]|uniref:helix-turn-helix domain-containing protein n=1 Tax=Chengkuizengella sp. SCS-71B TaxID=3115290 RepID=UPI0032C23309
MKVGGIIKELRKGHKMTQVELAKKLNVAPTAVSAWERDENRPLLDKITILADMFNVPVSHFFKSSRTEQMSVGKNIKRVRKAKKITQNELANMSNMSRSYLADIERDRYNPSVVSLKRIAESLEINLSSLIDDDGNDKNVIPDIKKILEDNKQIKYDDVLIDGEEKEKIHRVIKAILDIE